MIHPHNLTLLRNFFPEVDQGIVDARAGIWREVRGDEASMAYEVGRMLAFEPPVVTSLGLLVMQPYIERAFKQLLAC